MTEELYNKINKFCNETDWSKYPTYEHALEEFIKEIVEEETKELEAQIEKMKCCSTCDNNKEEHTPEEHYRCKICKKFCNWELAD